MGCSVSFKYAKTALVAGALPQTPLGELTTFPQTSYSGADGRGGGKGPCPPTMDKKIKTQLPRYAYRRVAVTVINEHKTA